MSGLLLSMLVAALFSAAAANNVTLAELVQTVTLIELDTARAATALARLELKITSVEAGLATAITVSTAASDTANSAAVLIQTASATAMAASAAAASSISAAALAQTTASAAISAANSASTTAESTSLAFYGLSPTVGPAAVLSPQIVAGISIAGLVLGIIAAALSAYNLIRGARCGGGYKALQSPESDY